MPSANTPKKPPPTAKRAPRKKAAPTSPPAAQAHAVSMEAKRAQVRGEDGVQHDPYAPTIWGAGDAQGALVDLVLPSGQMCLAQRPGPEGLAAAGLLDDLDVLAPKVPKGTSKRLTAIKTEMVMKDPKKLAEAVKLMNRILVHVVIKPELTPEPDNPRDKEVGKIYPSSVSIEDKSFVFQWAVGGTADLATFRGKFEESVADVADGEDVEDTPE